MKKKIWNQKIGKYSYVEIDEETGERLTTYVDCKIRIYDKRTVAFLADKGRLTDYVKKLIRDDMNKANETKQLCESVDRLAKAIENSTIRQEVNSNGR